MLRTERTVDYAYEMNSAECCVQLVTLRLISFSMNFSLAFINSPRNMKPSVPDESLMKKIMEANREDFVRNCFPKLC